MSVIEREHEQVLVDPVREERARVLEAAALEIEVRGWCRGAFADDDGRLCMMSAIRQVDPTGSGVPGSLSQIAMITFNDCDARDAQDVTFVLRWRAAEIRDGR